MTEDETPTEVCDYCAEIVNDDEGYLCDDCAHLFCDAHADADAHNCHGDECGD